MYYEGTAEEGLDDFFPNDHDPNAPPPSPQPDSSHQHIHQPERPGAFVLPVEPVPVRELLGLAGPNVVVETAPVEVVVESSQAIVEEEGDIQSSQAM